MKLTFLVLEKVFDTGLSSMLDVFTLANELDGRAPFELALAGLGSSARTGLGMEVKTQPFEACSETDWLIVPALAAKLPDTLDQALARPDMEQARAFVLQRYGEGARIAAACTGTFIVAETGLLDGASATTTWSLSPFFRQRFPKVKLDETRLVWFSNEIATAGSMMGHVDLALWLVRLQSPDLARQVARFMLIDERSSQSAYIIPDFLAHADPLVEKFELWCRAHLSNGFSLQSAAQALAVHPRTLQRRTEAVLGKTPLGFFQDVRIERARGLLSQGLRLDAIANEVGYADATTLRNLLRRKLGYGVSAIRSGQNR